MESLTVLGVTFNSKLRFDSYIAHIINKAARTLYGLKTLRAHGLTGQSLWDVTRATLIAQILYAAAPAWWGFLSMAEKDRLQSGIRRSQRYGFPPGNFQSACDIVESLESNLFRSVCANPQHVLFRLLPPKKATGYNLRQRSHHPPSPK